MTRPQRCMEWQHMFNGRTIGDSLNIRASSTNGHRDAKRYVRWLVRESWVCRICKQNICKRSMNGTPYISATLVTYRPSSLLHVKFWKSTKKAKKSTWSTEVCARISNCIQYLRGAYLRCWEWVLRQIAMSVGTYSRLQFIFCHIQFQIVNGLPHGDHSGPLEQLALVSVVAIGQLPFTAWRGR